MEGVFILYPFNYQERKNKIQIIEKEMVPCKSTAKEVSFEWSHHRISMAHTKVRTMLHVSTIDSGRERVL